MIGNVIHLLCFVSGMSQLDNKDPNERQIESNVSRNQLGENVLCSKEKYLFIGARDQVELC